MDQHEINHSKRTERKTTSRRVPFAIDVKGGEKELEHDDRGSMSISINDKGGYC